LPPPGVDVPVRGAGPNGVFRFAATSLISFLLPPCYHR
jgi:hypothetical protein